MNKKQRYFVKQKLLGVAILLLTLIDIAALIAAPIGLFLIFTKRPILTDDYFIECCNKNIDKRSY